MMMQRYFVRALARGLRLLLCGLMFAEAVYAGRLQRDIDKLATDETAAEGDLSHAAQDLKEATASLEKLNNEIFQKNVIDAQRKKWESEHTAIETEIKEAALWLEQYKDNTGDEYGLPGRHGSSVVNPSKIPVFVKSSRVRHAHFHRVDDTATDTATDSSSHDGQAHFSGTENSLHEPDQPYRNNNGNNSNQILVTSSPLFLIAIFCMGAAGAASVSVYFREPRDGGYTDYRGRNARGIHSSAFSNSSGYQSVLGEEIDIADQERIVGTTSFS